MARYAEWNKFVENLKTDKYGDTDVIEVGIAFQKATADVVPKSEVEELIYKLECLLCHVTGGRLSKHTYELATMETVATDCINETYDDGYGEGYKDCATEIFAEIEELAKIYTIPVVKNGVVKIAKEPFWCLEPSDLAELKKKYQEGE